MNHLKETNANKLKLNFEYSFFKLIKSTLINDSLITNKNDLTLHLNFCLNKTIQQYNLFQIQNEPINDEYLDEFDENDEFNIIELMNNFQVNLLNLLHRFKEIYKEIRPENELNVLANEKRMDYYDYMSAFISIYIDISIELKFKIERFKLIDINQKHLSSEDLCLNTFCLLGKYIIHKLKLNLRLYNKNQLKDSCVYYVCNSILQLKSLNKENLTILIPIFQKIIDLKIPFKNESKNKIKVCRSLYLRFLLIYCLLRAATNDTDQIKFFKKFIYLIEIPLRFKKYIIKLLKHYASSNESNELIKVINPLESNKKLRRYFISQLEKSCIQTFVTSLHNKTFKIKNNDPFSPIAANQELMTNETQIFDNKPCESEIESDEPEYELEFTSDFSELTQYDVNSIVDPTELNQTMRDEPTDKLKQNATVLLQRIDLNKFTKTSKNGYMLTTKLETLSARKRYEEIARKKSPTRDNISKLNLFRNIYEENVVNIDYKSDYNSDYRYNIFNNSNSIQYSEAKFYKINDLVSIMIPDQINNTKNSDTEKQTTTVPIKNFNLIESQSNECMVKEQDLKDINSDIQSTKNQFRKRKQDFLEKNSIKTTIKVKRQYNRRSTSKKSQKIPSISITDYKLRARLPTVWYIDQCSTNETICYF